MPGVDIIVIVISEWALASNITHSVMLTEMEKNKL